MAEFRAVVNSMQNEELRLLALVRRMRHTVASDEIRSDIRTVYRPADGRGRGLERSTR